MKFFYGQLRMEKWEGDELFKRTRGLMMRGLILVLFLTACGASNEVSAGLEAKSNGLIRDAVANSEVYDLSEQERSDILFMWEEEKLARDVYVRLYDRWGLKVGL